MNKATRNTIASTTLVVTLATSLSISNYLKKETPLREIHPYCTIDITMDGIPDFIVKDKNLVWSRKSIIHNIKEAILSTNDPLQYHYSIRYEYINGQDIFLDNNGTQSLHKNYFYSDDHHFYTRSMPFPIQGQYAQFGKK